MENIIVFIIVGLAVAYVFKTFFGRSSKKGACSCGCTSCDIASQCDSAGKEKL